MVEMRALAFLEAVIRFVRRGKGFCSIEKIEERLNICKNCSHFTGYHCGLCNCCTNDKKTLFNKLAYPTERCPHDPPKWTEIQ